MIQISQASHPAPQTSSYYRPHTFVDPSLSISQSPVSPSPLHSSSVGLNLSSYPATQASQAGTRKRASANAAPRGRPKKRRQDAENTPPASQAPLMPRPPSRLAGLVSRQLPPVYPTQTLPPPVQPPPQPPPPPMLQNLPEARQPLPRIPAATGYGPIPSESTYAEPSAHPGFQNRSPSDRASWAASDVWYFICPVPSAKKADCPARHDTDKRYKEQPPVGDGARLACRSCP